MKQKKVLVLGATGAMGKYLIPYLAEAGYFVDAVSLDDAGSAFPNVRHIKANAKDKTVLKQLLEVHYDGIVDFMIYTSSDLAYYPALLLSNGGHYIFLSSYRVYDDKEHPVRETSPRLLDTGDSILLRNSDDYSIYKARGENVIRTFPRDRWTIIRPAITYSLMRYQLVTLEAPLTVGRALAGRKVVVPEQARNVQATMSWAGDVAKMILLLLFNEKALGETFSVCTAEHHTWGEIADFYKDICGLEAVWVDKEDFLRILNDDPFYNLARWQLDFDRLFDRVMDNSKVLAATGMKQKDLMKLYDGLKYEIGRCPDDYGESLLRSGNAASFLRMDDYLKEKGLF
ncbi:MAG: hypothetical protein J6A21_01490 [Lentisphaeria bacterium]|nr:hypothetical protein [Lentisphaeria bacterium]